VREKGVPELQAAVDPGCLALAAAAAAITIGLLPPPHYQAL
jgi:hypothetical protein